VLDPILGRGKLSECQRWSCRERRRKATTAPQPHREAALVAPPYMCHHVNSHVAIRSSDQPTPETRIRGFIEKGVGWHMTPRYSFWSYCLTIDCMKKGRLREEACCESKESTHRLKMSSSCALVLCCRRPATGGPPIAAGNGSGRPVKYKSAFSLSA
jgi:hypothetical protein